MEDLVFITDKCCWNKKRVVGTIRKPEKFWEAAHYSCAGEKCGAELHFTKNSEHRIGVDIKTKQQRISPFLRMRELGNDARTILSP